MAKKKAAEKATGVYTMKQKQSVKGKFQTAGAVVLRQEMTITHDYAEKINANTKTNGRYVELNKEADEAYKEASSPKKAAK